MFRLADIRVDRAAAEHLREEGSERAAGPYAGDGIRALPFGRFASDKRGGRKHALGEDRPGTTTQEGGRKLRSVSRGVPHDCAPGSIIEFLCKMSVKIGCISVVLQ